MSIGAVSFRGEEQQKKSSALPVATTLAGGAIGAFAIKEKITGKDVIKNDTFELKDFNNLKKLKSNDRSVTAYWLPNEEGSINEVYLWQGDTFIGEAINRSNTSYNECAIERTNVDNENMLHQNKRLAKFDKFVKEQKADIPKIGSLAISRAETYEAVEIMETVQPQGYETDDDLTVNDWAKFAKNSL